MGHFEERKAASRRFLVRAATPQDTTMNQQEGEPKLSSQLVTSSDTREADISRLVCRKVQQHNTLQESHAAADAAHRSSTYRKPATVCLNISTPSLVVVIVSALLSMILLLLSATSAEQTRVAVATTDSHLLESVRKISNLSEHHQLSFFSSHYQSQNQPQYPLIYDSRQEAQQSKEVNRRRTLERQEKPALVKQQNNHHQDQHKANKISNNHHYEYPKERGILGRRMKRSTGWSKSQQPSNSLESAGACGELLSAWTYFRSVYPALASHLFVLSSPGRSSLAELKSLSQHTNEIAQSVSKLLDEADRLLRSDRPTKTASWLSRAATNPAYARIIHHHLQQQRQQYQHQQPTRPPTEALPPARDGHVYGRLIHYPHQLEQGKSAATSKTLDKLRQLSGGQHQSTSADTEFSPVSQETDDEQLESNKIPVIAGDGESHWINQGEQSRGGSWKNLARARNDADSLRKKFVYGNVIYKPTTASPSEKEGETQQLYHRQNPIETLRQLTATASNNGENENNNNNNNNNKHLGATSSSSNYKQQQQQSVSANKQHPSVKANSESYGRILVSPASSSSNLATSAVSVGGAAATSFKEESSSQGANNNEQQKQLHSQTAAQAPQWPPKFTLDKLRQQLALNEPQSNPNAGPINIFPVDGHLLMDNGELVSQQEVGSQAAIASEQQQQQQEQSDPELLPANPGTSNDENEFEGVWHSGPIQQVEVRQLRTENINGQPRQLLITRTTADPRDAFLVE